MQLVLLLMNAILSLVMICSLCMILPFNHICILEVNRVIKFLNSLRIASISGHRTST
jgi:hypothetical protein